jgi:hypothetical protein
VLFYLALPAPTPLTHISIPPASAVFDRIVIDGLGFEQSQSVLSPDPTPGIMPLKSRRVIVLWQQ